MSVLKEFREFALKDSVVDLAVGVIIGAAFRSIVSSLVDDIIMPPISVLLAGIDFSALKLVLHDATPAVSVANAPDYIPAHPKTTINYNKFLNAIIKFTIVTWVLFLIIKMMNS